MRGKGFIVEEGGEGGGGEGRREIFICLLLFARLMFTISISLYIYSLHPLSLFSFTLRYAFSAYVYTIVRNFHRYLINRNFEWIVMKSLMSASIAFVLVIYDESVWWMEEDMGGNPWEVRKESGKVLNHSREITPFSWGIS